MTKAVEWCIENNARGHAAIKTGLFNLIKDRGTIDRRLDGKVKTDGHSSRFNFEVLQFCREKQIRMFVSPPDTTGVTQLLDQINQKLHLEYKNSKEGLLQHGPQSIVSASC